MMKRNVLAPVNDLLKERFLFYTKLITSFITGHLERTKERALPFCSVSAFYIFGFVRFNDDIFIVVVVVVVLDVVKRGVESKKFESIPVAILSQGFSARLGSITFVALMFSRTLA